MLDGRLYVSGGDRRVLAAAAWDGKTKYKLNETEEEKEKRLEKWDEYLSAGDKDQAKEGSGGDTTWNE